MEFIQASDLVHQISDGGHIALTGFGGMGQCDSILKAIRESFLATGHPKDLRIFHAAGQSDGTNGLEYIALDGLISKVIGGHWGLLPKMRDLIERDKLEAYCLPQGQLTHLFRTMANGLPGHFTPIGLGTFVDPRVEGGKFNERAKASGYNPVEVVNIMGTDYLFYKSVAIDYVFIRGTSVDEAGNISVNEEPLKLELLSAAQAAKAQGGKVIVQVKHVLKRGSIHPKEVAIPGYLVDYVVIAEHPELDHRQVPSAVFDPRYSGDLRVPEQAMPKLPFSVRKLIGRRAVKELKEGAVINLGIGIPGDVIGPVSAEEGLLNKIVFTIESGVVGGVPAGKNQFGIAVNADAILDHASQFDHYHGCGIDITFMGAAQIDERGNVNVSQFGGRKTGCGGFIDVTQPAKKVVFCTTFTNGGLEVAVEDGKLHILKEGVHPKFVRHVEQITFSGSYAGLHDKEVVYVTERAVFVLSREGLILTEIAPGINLQDDILRLMDFTPIVSPDLKLMDESMFVNGAGTTLMEVT
ncbi:acyl CoA:acetate/3-ketoacid CoA transferase [Alicyclobacillus fastidiosus]|uniref:Acyl CoA:acetate/3-ketoacid CoA transferase n=1 Tax=Alicyclobacillus fastidiosus TaxID=392011 RepID=A0ABY6ZCE5_9BACL|nr:CoA-transferase [Alicyclobacillus fastidiosus]WAH40564.1 acyl CoA:acetate/3-ketoacid CoA transferase [Alicyclobacillus fastidiosus]GMA61999.1 propionate CoA-transferase [Alicyclobacillus fastidiosus]